MTQEYNYTTCLECLLAETSVDPAMLATKIKGGLRYPSKKLIDICRRADKAFRLFRNTNDAHQKMVHYVMTNFMDKSLFLCNTNHKFETDLLNNHENLLLKTIIEKYFDLKRYYNADNSKKSTKRQILSRLVIFRGE
jgi:hypothetical protein